MPFYNYLHLSIDLHSITKQLEDGFFANEEVAIKEIDKLKMLVKNSTSNNLSAPHRLKILILSK